MIHIWMSQTRNFSEFQLSSTQTNCFDTQIATVWHWLLRCLSFQSSDKAWHIFGLHEPRIDLSDASVAPAAGHLMLRHLSIGSVLYLYWDHLKSIQYKTLVYSIYYHPHIVCVSFALSNFPKKESTENILKAIAMAELGTRRKDCAQGDSDSRAALQSRSFSQAS
jgi:hypothetical protein